MDDVLRRRGRMMYENHSRKNKSGLSIFKKRLKISKIYKRLGTKLSVHSRNIRALTNSWNTEEIKSLVDQYEITSMLKSLSDSADAARLKASSASQDFLKLRQTGFLCDLTLVTKDINDRQIECCQVNCSLFCKRTGLVLNKGKDMDYGTEKLFCLPPHTNPVTCTYSQNTLTFVSQNFPQHFLKKMTLNVYSENALNDATGNIQPEAQTSVTSKKFKSNKENNEEKSQSNKTPLKLSNKITNTISKKMQSRGFASDMRDLYLSANTSGDVKLTFISTSSVGGTQSSLLCHSFVLAARSSFLKAVIEKQKARHDGMAASSCPAFMTVQLESKVFSPKYLPVVLFAMYTDEIDLQRISRSGFRPSCDLEYCENIKDLMEISYLGRFLSFPRLIHACEDLIVTKFNSSNVIEVLRWSSKPHGSPWLRRRVIQHIRDNFAQISSALCDLTKQELSEVIGSDYVNSPELEILKVVLNWGERELLRNLEAIGPNLVQTHITLNSRSKSYRTPSLLTARRHELLLTSNSEELHDCTADLLSDVRLAHILPPNHEVVSNAMKRGVISSPPEHLLEWHHPGGANPNSHRAFFWLRDKAGLGFSPPRLFTTHWDEAKAILEDRICQESASSSVALRSIPNNSAHSTLPSGGVVPDALYMVGTARHNCDTCHVPQMGVTSLATTRLKYVNKVFPVPDPSTASKLLSHERRLRQNPLVKEILQSCHSASVGMLHCCCKSQRFSANPLEIGEQSSTICNLCRAEHYIRLTCVRELDLPDETSDVLRRPHLYYDPDDLLALHSATSRGTIRSRVKAAPQTSRRRHLFQKRTRNKSCDMMPPVTVHRSWNRSCDFSSNSDLSEDGNNEWPFPYINAVPPHFGHDSDSCVSVEAINVSIPDVAASAHSTIKSLLSLSSNSNSDSSSPFPGDLFLRKGNNSDESTETVAHKRKAVTSYAQYLSTKKAPKKSDSSSRSSSNFRLYPKTNPTSTEKSNPGLLQSSSSGTKVMQSSLTKEGVSPCENSLRFLPTQPKSDDSCSISTAQNWEDIYSNMRQLNVQENDHSSALNPHGMPSCSYSASAVKGPDICSSALQFIDADSVAGETDGLADNAVPTLISESLLLGTERTVSRIENREKVLPADNGEVLPLYCKPDINKSSKGVSISTTKAHELRRDNLTFSREENVTDTSFGEEGHKPDNFLENSQADATLLINESVSNNPIIDKETVL